jgi:hypothetical protein
MKRILFITPVLIVLLMAAGTFSSAQAQKEPITYILGFKYPTNVEHYYKMTENTVINRMYNDSSRQVIKRQVTYYFMQKLGKQFDNDFLTVDVTIDSMTYLLNDGKTIVDFNSQNGEYQGVEKTDLKHLMVPLGKMYSITYSPYGEVLKIEGEKLDWLRNYVTKEGKDVLDSLEKFIWLDGISLERLQYLTDVKKISFPKGMIKEDSVWKSYLPMQIDGRNFGDSVQVKFVSYKDGEYTIKAESEKFVPNHQQGLMYGIDRFAKVDSCTGKGTYSVSLTPRGSIKKSESNYQTVLHLKIGREPLVETITSNATWELLNQRKY